MSTTQGTTTAHLIFQPKLQMIYSTQKGALHTLQEEQEA